jgi:Transglycosylase-like domain
MRKHRVSTLPLAAAVITIAAITVSAGSLGAAAGPTPDGSALAGRTAGQVGSLLALDSLAVSTPGSGSPTTGAPGTDGSTSAPGGPTIALSSLQAPVVPAPVTFPVATTTTIAPTPQSPSTADDVWVRLRQCESGGDYTSDTGNGYYGAYQFSESTWLGIGETGFPNEAPPAVQDQAAQRLQARSGWGQWPACSQRLGL